MHLFMAGAIVHGEKGSNIELINDLFDPISEQKPLDYSTLYLIRKDRRKTLPPRALSGFPAARAPSSTPSVKRERSSRRRPPAKALFGLG